MRDARARQGVEELGRDVLRCPLAGRPMVQIAGTGAHVLDELRERRRGHVGIDDEQDRRRSEPGDRREVAPDVEARVAVERRIDGHGVGREEQRVAVPRRRDRLGADVPARPAAVVDDHGLREAGGQPVRD
jgi:hypothetical protein